MDEKYKFHIDGMHCNACVLSNEERISKIPGVKAVEISLQHRSVELVGNFPGKSSHQVQEDLNQILNEHGYFLSFEKKEHQVEWMHFYKAVPLALFFIVLFIFLQKLNIVNLVEGSTVNFGTALLLGLIASISTCMAVVGGLVLSMSANYAKSGSGKKEQVFFHLSRLVTFFILGGVIGVIGSQFTLNATCTFILSVIVALILLILGLNLLDIFPNFKKFQITMPKIAGKYIHGMKSMNHVFAPLLLGTATFFLPCGFTQSMQIYSLSTGSFLEGALTMFAFALGTLPVLSLISFSSSNIYKKVQSGIFFKTVGLIVIFFGVLNLANALAIAGVIPPIFTF